MNATYKIRFLLVALTLTFFLLCFTNVLRAIDPTSGSHELMSGDLDGDGNIDYLFRGIDKFVLIANDGINIPIILKQPHLVLQQGHNNHFSILTDVSDLIAFSDLWKPGRTALDWRQVSFVPEWGNVPLSNHHYKFVGDFNGDGRTDLGSWYGLNGDIRFGYSTGNGGALDWQQASTGEESGWGDLPANPSAWKFTGDFNGDGRTDLGWWYGANGDIRIGYSTVNGTLDWQQVAVVPEWGDLPANPSAWKFTGDFNGDGRTDLGWWNGVNGDCRIGYSTEGALDWQQASVDIGWGNIPLSNSHYKFVGDFNGDGRTDLGWWYGANGDIRIGYSTQGRDLDWQQVSVVPEWGDLPANPSAWKFTGNFNGDGLAGIGWWYGANGNIRIGYSTAGDLDWQQVVGNFNGDAYGDLLFLSPGFDHGGFIVYGSKGDGLTIGNYIDESFIGVNAMNGTHELSVFDSDENGTDDLVFYDENGTEIAIAYSDGNSFTTLTQPDEPTRQWTTLSDSNRDVFSPIPPNSAGISVNRMDTFDAQARPVIISNFAGTIQTPSGDVEKDAAKVIVIIANSVNITQPVKVLGAKADILFITESPTGGFTCNNGSFDGVYRVSVVTQGSASDINTSNTDLGTFIPGANTSVHIAGLKAPNAIGLDILTENLNANASADLTRKVSVMDDGAIVADANGDKTLSSGSINILLGNIEWHYQDNRINKVTPDGVGSKTVTGYFHAKTVRIGTNDHLIVNSNVSTLTDYATAVSYHGAIFLPEESVDYQSLDGNLIVAGRISSEGDVRYKASGKIDIYTEGDEQQGKNLKLTLGSDLYIPYGKKLVAENIEIIVPRHFYNSGSIQAVQDLKVITEGSIYNQYGGEIFGDQIYLEARGVIRNGSRTPYASFQSSPLLDISEDRITKTLNTLDYGTLVGTFYRMNVDVEPNTTLPLMENQKAHIVGKKITAIARVIENINPYYLHVDDPDNFIMKRDKISQVSIFAENKLSLEAKGGYIINSSALMYLNQPGGNQNPDELNALELKAKAVINERYRLHFQPDYNSSKSIEYYDGQTTFGTKTTAEIIETKTKYCSPPGVIRSAGNLHIDADAEGGHFLNNASYLEIYGEIQAKARKFYNRGYQHQGIGRTLTEKDTFVFYYGRLKWVIPASSENTVKVDPSDLDSLLYTGKGDNGGLRASDANGELRVYAPFDDLIDLRISQIISEDFSWVSSFYTEDKWYFLAKYYYPVKRIVEGQYAYIENADAVKSGEVSELIEEPTIKVKVVKNETIQNFEARCKSCPPPYDETDPRFLISEETITFEETHLLPLFDELKKLNQSPWRDEKRWWTYELEFKDVVYSRPDFRSIILSRYH